jgi:SAM-dependent methyltransferase
VKGYRKIQHWNQWLSHQYLGKMLLEAEQKLLAHLLEKHYGKHGLLIGVPQQYALLKASETIQHYILSPLMFKDSIYQAIESDLDELPLLSGSVDLVILPHTHEVVDNPRQLLAEACRIIKPEGIIVICGFNPYSAWGVKRFFAEKKSPPWSNHFVHTQLLKRWLQLADFKLEQQASTLFRPPLNHPSMYANLHLLEKLGSTCWPLLGGVYALVARAKVIPLTPIRMTWKQPLSGIRISPSISAR